MITLDFSLDSSKNGGRITSFSYSHGLNELVGSWRANVAGGSFKAGNSITFTGAMKDGFISSAYKDSSGLWHLEGKDAGVRLMKSVPDISDLPEGNAKAVLRYIADFCGIDIVMTVNGLSGFNVRSLISGSTCAEAVLELAMFSGLIAYIDRSGNLVIQQPATLQPSLQNIINDSGSDIDLDGYATQVLVTLNRRKWPDAPDDEPPDDDDDAGYIGETPSIKTKQVTKSGFFSNGSYYIITLEPFGVIKRVRTSITDNGVTISNLEKHDYDYKAKVIWRDNQEYVLFAFIETGYSLTRTVEGSYGEGLSFKETTTETMTRSFSAIDATIGIPDDWAGELDMVSSETVTRSTVREGGKTPSENMPSYSPPFDSQVTRTYTRENGGKGLLCNETELSYEARQVGSISPVKVNGQLVPHFLGGTLAIQTHSSPQWVLVKKHRAYYEQYDADGACVLSTRSEYSDDGAEWLTANALNDTGDDDLNDYQKAYATFSQSAQGLDVDVGSSVLSSAWNFLELQGRTKVNDPDAAGDISIGDVSQWYDNGAYVRQAVCPHYNSSAKTCNVYSLAGSSTDACIHYRGTGNWYACSRAVAALNIAKQQDSPQLEVPVVGSAAVKNLPRKSPAVGYRRDIYVDDILSDAQAQSIADTIAANILVVKGTKGFRKTVAVPYDPSLQPDGVILEVAHDWENLQTSVTLKDTGDIPDFLISESVAAIAAFVAARQDARLNIPQYGSVLQASGNFATVKVGEAEVSCSTKLRGLAQGDIVLVAFPAGNKLRGQVISKL